MRGAAPRAGHFLLRGQEKVTKEKAALCIALSGALCFSLREGFADRPSLAWLQSCARPCAQPFGLILPPLRCSAMQKGTLSVPALSFCLSNSKAKWKRCSFPWGAAEHRSHFRGSEGMSERGGFLPRELPERPEMTRSTGHRVAASLREMVLGTFAETKVPRRAGAKSPH